MTGRIDISGQKFWRWMVLSSAGNNKHGHSVWNCVCDCGTVQVVCGQDLKAGKHKSCGCLRTERNRAMGLANRRHGQAAARSREYKAWANMRGRCLNPIHQAYADYGGRGITVCDSWAVFENFLADMGSCPLGLTLERKDVNKGYEPDNCEWATWERQSNNRRSSRFVTYQGVTRTVAQWARVIGVSKGLLRYRLEHHWPLEMALAR